MGNLHKRYAALIPHQRKEKRPTVVAAASKERLFEAWVSENVDPAKVSEFWDCLDDIEIFAASENMITGSLYDVSSADEIAGIMDAFECYLETLIWKNVSALEMYAFAAFQLENFIRYFQFFKKHFRRL